MSPVEKAAVLVTGSSSGFGYVTSTTLARRGYHVFASMRGVAAGNASAAESLKQLAAEEGLPITVVDLDVRDQESVNAAVERVIDRAGRVDVLVNNAGAGCHGSSRRSRSLRPTSCLTPTHTRCCA